MPKTKMTETTATLTREGKWWVIQMDALRLSTQARTRTDAVAMTKDCICCAFDDSSIRVHVRLDDEDPNELLISTSPIWALEDLAKERTDPTSSAAVGVKRRAKRMDKEIQRAH